MKTITEISREAWASTKKEPAFDDLIPAYRDGLIQRAEKVYADRRVSNEGADIFREFEQVVLELIVPERFHAPAVAPEEVKEESEPVALKGPLPKDFPAIDKLHAAGINTYGQLAKVDDLTEIEGIGPATAKLIVKALSK